MLFFYILFQAQDDEREDDQHPSTVQDWMLLCHHQPDFEEGIAGISDDVDWSAAGKSYADLQEMPSFIAQQRQHYVHPSYDVTVDPQRLQGKQLEAYKIVCDHYHSEESMTPLRMIVSGTAGTGKSYLIRCLENLLGDHLRVTAPTGGAAYNVHGHTLHSLLGIPVKGDFRDLEGQRLHTIQESLTGVDYLILDEMSMVGRKLFGQVDRRLRQAFPHR